MGEVRGHYCIIGKRFKVMGRTMGEEGREGKDEWEREGGGAVRIVREREGYWDWGREE